MYDTVRGALLLSRYGKLGTRDFVARASSHPPSPPPDPRSIRRGGLMTGYGILLTFDSRVRYARATLVRRMSPARAKVSSHPHSSRFKYQTQTERGRKGERWRATNASPD